MKAPLHTVLIVNPRAGGGRTGKRWRDMEAVIRRSLPDFEVVQTEAPGHATALTRERLAAGADLVVAVGGDGTNHEVINGFFDAQLKPVRAGASFACIPTGTGSDLGRSFELRGGLRAAAERIAAAGVRQIDLGSVSFCRHDGAPGQRIFANIASFGISALVVQKVNQRAGGGALAYISATVAALMRHRNAPVELVVDGQPHERADLTFGAVANGRYFGGGMQVAPQASLDSGHFWFLEFWGWQLARAIASLPRLYSGDLRGLNGVKGCDARRLVATPAGDLPILIELDGEQPGRLPATFEIMPKALRVKL